MRYATFAVLLCSSLFTSSCRLFGPDEAEFPIDGTWYWVESVGGIFGARISADSVDYVQAVHFIGQVQAQWLVDGEVVQIYGLSTERREDGDVLMMKPYRKEGLYRLRKWINVADVANEHLVLYDDCYDCYTHYFTREPNP